MFLEGPSSDVPTPDRALVGSGRQEFAESDTQDARQRKRLTTTLADLDQRIERQLAAIESGVDPVLLAERIRTLKDVRQQTEMALSLEHRAGS
jgi:hypothetical protein